MPERLQKWYYIDSRASQRSNTSQGWTDQNPVLLAGEIGIETDTLKVKVGDGSNTWRRLPYWVNGSVVYGATTGITIVNNVISANLLYDVINTTRRRIYTSELQPVSSCEPLPAYVSG